MNRPTKPLRRWLIPTLLVLSLGLNGYLLLQDTNPAQSHAATRRAGLLSQGLGRTEGRPPRHTARLQQQLRLCRLQSWQLVMRQVKRNQDPRAKEDVPAAATGYAAQREALCGIGLKQLRRNWSNGRAVIAANLLRDLADPDVQRKDVRRFADDLDVTLNLSGRQRNELERRYGPIRDARVSNALDSLQQDPPDYEAVLDEAFTLFKEEDHLIRSLFGEKDLRLARESRLERRTAVISILAAMADVPWDKDLQW